MQTTTTSRIFLIALIMTMVFSSCRIFYPRAIGFEKARGSEAGWSSILIKDGMNYNMVWDDVSSIIVRRFEPEMISKETGYIRTKWNYSWTTSGKNSKVYRVRTTIKMSEERRKIEVHAEAQKKSATGKWISGFDTELLSTMKQDIAGVAGM